MKILLIFAAIMGFINGFSVDSKGAFFSPPAKAIIAILGVVELLVAIVVAVIQHYWVEILISIALFVVLYKIGYAIMRHFLRNPPNF